MMSLSRVVRLNTGALMPRIGLGTYSPTGDSVQTAIDCALHLGYRHIDTAVSYRTEAQIGQVIEDNIKTGKVKRKDLFVTTKIPPVYLAPKDIKPTLEESLDNLKISNVDLLLIHSPYALKNRGDGNYHPQDSSGRLVVEHHNLRDMWTVFEEVHKQGLSKAIGVSNFTVKQMDLVLGECNIVPANLQLECHAYLQQRELRQYCDSKGIVVTGYAPLGAAGRPVSNIQDDDPVLLEDPVVRGIAESLKRTPSQILLRYLIQLGVAPLPKSVNPVRLEENFQVFDFELDSETMTKMASLNAVQMKYFAFKKYSHHPEYAAPGEAF